MDFYATDPINDKLCVALGYFDCVHLGHARVLAAARALADRLGATAAAFTFSDDMTAAFKGGEKRLYSFDERVESMKACGMDSVIRLPFDERVKNTLPAEFLHELTSRFDVVGLACGPDYTFGKGGAGNVGTLRDYCREMAMELAVVEPLIEGGTRVSTGRIRGLIEAGEVDGAAALLGRRYTVSGKVVRGRGEGHLFGIPTANIEPSEGKLLPAAGVYACEAEADGKRYRAVVNVGDKPTFSDATPSVEAHLGGFDGDLYGKAVTLSFVRYLRGIKRFASPQALAEQVKKDLSWE